MILAAIAHVNNIASQLIK